jgi:hypothetical protein
MASNERVTDLVIIKSRYAMFLPNSSQEVIGVDKPALRTANDTPAHAPRFDVIQKIGTRYMG